MSVPYWSNRSLDQMLIDISRQVSQREQQGMFNDRSFNRTGVYNVDYKIYDVFYTIDWKKIYSGIDRIHREESDSIHETNMLFANVFRTKGRHLMISNTEQRQTMMECEPSTIENQIDFVSATYDELLIELVKRMNTSCSSNVKRIFIKEIIRRATGYREEIDPFLLDILLVVSEPKELVRMILFIIGQIDQMKRLVPVNIKNERKTYNVTYPNPKRNLNEHCRMFNDTNSYVIDHLMNRNMEIE